jgi:hypothetical protein
MIHAQMREPIGGAQIGMGQQRAYGLQRRGLPPDWPGEGKPLSSEFAADTARTNAAGSGLRNDGYGCEPYSSKAISTVLGTKFVR